MSSGSRCVAANGKREASATQSVSSPARNLPPHRPQNPLCPGLTGSLVFAAAFRAAS